jgi:hypothetical protein
MSMYTQLLNAAFAQRPPAADRSESDAIDRVVRCRTELDEGAPPGTDADSVPVVLALEIGYDVSLLDLAAVVGVDTDPGRFDQPQSERERLERAFAALGIDLHRPAVEATQRRS